MADFLLDHEPAIRMSFFIGVFAFIAILELLIPRRSQKISKRRRWPNNIGLVVLNTVLLRFAFPVLAVAFALLAEEKGWGLFNMIDMPIWLAMAIAFLALDLAIYGQHVLFHAVPLFWRMHRVHHADLEFDVTTGLRFHPFEILVSMGIKFAAIAVIGPPAVVVLIFEVVLNATSMFNHGNFYIPRKLDSFLRWFVVTPDMHRIHHSARMDETNSNFGFNLPWWDRLFGTYRAQPHESHDNLTIGLAQFRREKDLRIDKMLIQPFAPLDTMARPGSNQVAEGS